MTIKRFVKNLEIHPLVQPDLWGVTIDMNRFVKDRFEPFRLRDKIAEPGYPFYIEQKKNGTVYYDIGAYCWYEPTRRDMNPTGADVWDFMLGEEDFERILRNAEFAAKIQSSGFVVKNFQNQLQVDRIMGLGEFFHLQTCWWTSFSICYNFLRPWNTKLWFTQMLIGCTYHFLYRKIFMFHELYRYRHGRFLGRGMFRIGRIARRFTWWVKRKFHRMDPWKQLAVERHCQLFISEKKVFNRLFKQRILCITAFLFAIYRLFTYVEMCSIPAKYVPRPPYPWADEGLATGNWLQSPGKSVPFRSLVDYEKWGTGRTIPRLLSDNIMGFVGSVVAVCAIMKIFGGNGPY